MTATTQTHAQAVEMILSVMRDGQRNDRNLFRADDGHYFTSPDSRFIGNDGPYTVPYITIPVSDGGNEYEEEETARLLIQQLDEEIEVAEEV